MKALVLVIAGGGDIHEINEVSQRKTWAGKSSINIEVFWLKASGSSDYKFEDRTLYVPCPDTVDSVLEKVILGIKWVIEQQKYDFLIISNTSTYIDLRKTESRLLQKAHDSRFVGGSFEYTRKEISNIPKGFKYLNASPLYLGLEAAGELSRMDYSCFAEMPLDLALYKYLRDLGYPAESVARNNLCTHHLFVPKSCIRVKSWNNPTLTVKRMYLIFDYFESRTHFERFKCWVEILRVEIQASNLTIGNGVKYLDRILKVFARK